jgi:predicted anti-sigma-YlaC factor YlaD
VTGPVAVDRGGARLRLACASSTCSGTVELSVTRTVRTHTAGRIRQRSEVVLLGRASYRIDAGTRRTITVRLDPTARRLLASARPHRLAVTVRLLVAGTTPRNYRLALT